MEKIAIIIPSRGRPELMKALIESWEKTTQGGSNIIMGLDTNDPELNNYPIDDERFGWLIGPQKELNEKNNNLARGRANDYEIIGCLSDDFVFLSKDWEGKVIECQESLKGICYGNDLLQGRNLPTAPFIHNNIIKALGYAAPPVLKHYYIDNYWLELGMRLNRLQYIPDMIIEHRHWSSGKSIKDETYSKSETLMGQDREAWDHYRAHLLAGDVEKVQQFKS